MSRRPPRGPEPAGAGGDAAGRWEADGQRGAEELAGFTPTRIVLNNLFPVSLFNTLFFPLPLFTTSFVLLQRPKGQGNKGEFVFCFLRCSLDVILN